MKKQEYIGFADLAVVRRKINAFPINQVNTLINWKRIDTIIGKSYSKGESVAGRPSYPGLLLFKICLLQSWYDLSDYEVEDQVNDRISFSRFVGLSLDDKCPDHSVISRFRRAMIQKKAYDKGSPDKPWGFLLKLLSLLHGYTRITTFSSGCFTCRYIDTIHDYES
ncbi:MAG: transposase [Phocaeicola sp.]